MNREKFISAIEEMLEMQPGELSVDSDIKESANWDSMAIMNLVLLVDQEFSKDLELDKFHTFKTVGDIVEYVGL